MRAAAYLNLGVHVFKTLLRRAVGGAGGLGQVEATYVAEGHRPMDEDERRLAIALGRCIGCARCDAESKSGGYAGPMAMVLGASRGPEAVSTADAAAFSGEDLVALERVCQTRVPLRHLAARLRG